MILRHAAFIILFSAIVLQSALAAEQKTQSLDLLIEEALANNPRVHSVLNEWEAAEEKTKQVAVFPDPIAKYTYIGEPVETKIGPQERKYGLSQKIPFPVKLGLKTTAQAKHADMLNQKYEAAKREVIKNVKLVYYDLSWTDKAVQVTREEKTILEGLETVARRKYESNRTPQQDVIKAQVEITKLINELLILRRNRKTLKAKMNSILNRQEDLPIRTVSDISAEPFTQKLDDLREMARTSRQELLTAELGVEKAKYERSLAEFDFVPDVTLGFDYIRVGDGYTNLSNDGNDAWMGTLAINVPIWADKVGAHLKEKKAAVKASILNYEDVKNKVVFNVEDLYFKITTYWETILLYENALVPQAEQSFNAARTGYETGRVDFLNWLDSERMLLRTRLAYYRAITDYLKSIALLERAVGQDL
ncbi:MAG: TolC family protein [Candidatus Omnitrophota bacterium]